MSECAGFKASMDSCDSWSDGRKDSGYFIQFLETNKHGEVSLLYDIHFEKVVVTVTGARPQGPNAQGACDLRAGSPVGFYHLV